MTINKTTNTFKTSFETVQDSCTLLPAKFGKAISLFAFYINDQKSTP